MGGVLQYKWEVYCGTCLSSRLRSQPVTALPNAGRIAVQIPWSHKPVSLNGRLENCKIGGCKEIRQPFANPLPTFSANPSPTLSFRGPQAPVQRHGLTVSWCTKGSLSKDTAHYQTGVRVPGMPQIVAGPAQIFSCLSLRGRRVGAGMGGRSWGVPISAKTLENTAFSHEKMQNRLCQPFANPLPTFSANPSATPSFLGLQAPV